MGKDGFWGFPSWAIVKCVMGSHKYYGFPITNNYKKFHFKGILTCLPSEFSEKWKTID